MEIEYEEILCLRLAFLDSFLGIYNSNIENINILVAILILL